MATLKLQRFAARWTPDPGDPFGEDKKRLIRFLLDNGINARNPEQIDAIREGCGFERPYTRPEFQRLLLGPLRRDPRVFIGWGGGGVFLVTEAEDVDAALASYTSRIRAELHHARQLKKLARRTRVMEGYRTSIPRNKDRATIYIDESGTPSVADLDQPLFVVAAVVVESREDLAQLDVRFRNVHAALRRPVDQELKASRLSPRAHTKTMRELSLLDYQWAAACFEKPRLEPAVFADPLAFYRYAFQFLVGDLLTLAWRADLVIDQNSTPQMQDEFEGYLRRQNSGLPVTRLGDVTFADSSKVRLVQLADLVAGAVRKAVEGQDLPLREIEDKMINLQFWPPR